MEYFVISAKFVPLKYYTLSSQLRRLTSFSVGVFGSSNSVTRPDRRNAKMVYTIDRDYCVMCTTDAQIAYRPNLHVLAV